MSAGSILANLNALEVSHSTCSAPERLKLYDIVSSSIMNFLAKVMGKLRPKAVPVPDFGTRSTFLHSNVMSAYNLPPKITTVSLPIIADVWVESL